MARKLSKAEAEAVLRDVESHRAELGEVLKALPPDVDPELAADAAMTLVWKGVWTESWRFARACGRLPPPAIRAVLRRLPAAPGPHAVVLRDLVPLELDDAALEAAWGGALQALLDLQTSYGWGSKQKRAKLQALAAEPRLLGAVQAAAGACEEAPVDLLAVLAIDASEASVDALLPHVERAAREKDRGLDLLQRLRTHARSTPTLDALLARVEGLLEAREAASPALLLARELGFGEVETFWFFTLFGSTGLDRSNVPVYQVSLRVDSREADWLSVHVSGPVGMELRIPGTSFGADAVHRDELGLGRCAASELPQWLARSARKLGVTWSLSQVDPSTSVRGKKRERLARWLRGEG
jgi:hypothetical protein